MTSLALLDDRELDQLLAGHTPDGHEDLAPLADLATAVRARAGAQPAPVMSYALRQALAEASAGPMATPARHRRRLVEVLAAGVGVVAFGAVTAAGALPAPMQNAVADAVDLVGVHVPHADEEPSEPSRVDQGDQGDTGTGAGGEVEDEGERAGDRGDKVNGPRDTTPGGATPADPGTPGDQEPATPATPPEQSGGGNGNGSGTGQGNGTGNADGNGTGNADDHPGQGTPGQGQGNGTTGQGQGTTGQGQGTTGKAKAVGKP